MNVTLKAKLNNTAECFFFEKFNFQPNEWLPPSSCPILDMISELLLLIERAEDPSVRVFSSCHTLHSDGDLRGSCRSNGHSVRTHSVRFEERQAELPQEDTDGGLRHTLVLLGGAECPPYMAIDFHFVWSVSEWYETWGLGVSIFKTIGKTRYTKKVATSTFVIATKMLAKLYRSKVAKSRLKFTSSL